MNLALTAKQKPESARQATPAKANRPLIKRRSGLGENIIQRQSGSCACGGGCPRCQEQALLQTKLKISEPSDQYEQEADRVADEVMRRPEPQVQRQIEPEAEEELQRQPLEEKEEEEETLQTKPLAEEITPLVQRQAEPMEEEEEETLQTKTTSGQTPIVSSSLQNRITALQGGGQLLPQSERAFFEPRFGADFSQVRVHADSKAAETAHAVNARAFTLGRDIVFGAGQYQPSASEGRRLLAHELTHVLQQHGGGLRVRRKPITTPSTRTKSAKKSAKNRATVKESLIDCYIFIYETSDKRFASVWRASAEFFARSHDGLAVESGSNTLDTIKKLIQAYSAKSGKYRCIKAIEFLGHGSPGEALSGGFKAKDFQANKSLQNAQAPTSLPTKSSKMTPNIQKHTNLHTQFTLLKKLLCSSSYFHFRTCNTLKSPQNKKSGKLESGSFLAKKFGTHVIGHTTFVDTLLPGRRVFLPSGKEAKMVPSKLIAKKTPISSLSFRDFLLTISTQRVELSIHATVISDTDPEVYLLKLRLIKPRIVRLPEILPLARQLPNSAISPTLKAIRKAIRKDKTVVYAPIDRRIIERFTLANPKLSFNLQSESLGKLSFELKGISTPPSQKSIKGIGLGGAFLGKNVVPLVRPFWRVPLYDYRGIIGFGVEGNVSLGPNLIAGELGVPLTLEVGGLLEAFKDLPLDNVYLGLTPSIGYGRFLGEVGITGGIGFNLGAEWDKKLDAGLQLSLTYTPAGYTNFLMLRMGWKW